MGSWPALPFKEEGKATTDNGVLLLDLSVKGCETPENVASTTIGMVVEF